MTYSASLAKKFPKPTWYSYGSSSRGRMEKAPLADAPDAERGMIYLLWEPRMRTNLTLVLEIGKELIMTESQRNGLYISTRPEGKRAWWMVLPRWDKTIIKVLQYVAKRGCFLESHEEPVPQHCRLPVHATRLRLSYELGGQPLAMCHHSSCMVANVMNMISETSSTRRVTRVALKANSASASDNLAKFTMPAWVETKSSLYTWKTLE